MQPSCRDWWGQVYWTCTTTVQLQMLIGVQEALGEKSSVSGSFYL